jgi:hypothetical protein
MFTEFEELALYHSHPYRILGDKFYLQFPKVIKEGSGALTITLEYLRIESLDELKSIFSILRDLNTI